MDNNHVSQADLIAFQNNILNPEEREKFLEHICSCNYCSEQLAKYMEEEIIKAPMDMKSNILKAVKRPDVQLAVKASETSKRMQLFLYSLKVGTATIGALIVLMLTLNFSNNITNAVQWSMPRSVPISEESKTSLTFEIRKNMDNLSNSITKLSNNIMNTEVNNYDKKEK